MTHTHSEKVAGLIAELPSESNRGRLEAENLVLRQQSDRPSSFHKRIGF